MDNDLAELYAALSAAQGEIDAAVFDKTNPSFRSRYATLNSVREAIRGPLAKHGLGVMLDPVYYEAKHMVGCTATLVHKSGQCVVSKELCVPVLAITSKENRAAGIIEPITAQHVGIAITYVKRYLLCAMLNLTSDEDDDGNAVSHSGESVAQPPRPLPPQAPKPQAQAPQPPAPPPAAPLPQVDKEAVANLMIAQTQWKEKYAQLRAAGLADKNAPYFASAKDTVEDIAKKIIQMNKILSDNGIAAS